MIKINSNSNKGYSCGNAVLNSLRITSGKNIGYYQHELLEIIEDYGYSTKQVFCKYNPTYNNGVGNQTLNAFIKNNTKGIYVLYTKEHFILWNADKEEITDTYNCGSKTQVLQAYRVRA